MKTLDERIISGMSRLYVAPITYKYAAAYVNKNHRHHNASIGCKFCIAVVDDDLVVHGVAICGRPVARHLDDGFTLEINRVCTDGARNACSMLYGACIRTAKAMGYKKVITYILESENGASVKAANFKDCGIAGGKNWTGERNKGQNIPREMKRRFEYQIKERENLD